MCVKASVELTLASSSFSKSVTGLGPEGPGSRPEIGCAAVARAAGVGAGKEAGGAEESPACPLVLDCPQTRLTLISRNKASRFLALTFMRRNYRDRPRSMQLILHSIFKIRIDRVGDGNGRIPEVWELIPALRSSTMRPSTQNILLIS